ncbi:hypothetical protein B0O99DRAFT_364898 [Bisporella sp. PMI_857]|nr:hypothetical protein B0O99DRAFT_364898 [Bisporella sp. PMI_857]
MLFIDKMPSRDDGDEIGEAETAAPDESAWTEGRPQRYEKHGSRSKRKESNKAHADKHVWPRRRHNSSPRRTPVTWEHKEDMYDGEALEEDHRDTADKKNRRYQQYSSPSERTYSSYAPSIPGVRYVAALQIVTVKPHAGTYVSITYRRHR